jgi:hypothetical protein
LVAHIEGGTKVEGVRNWVLRRMFGYRRDGVTGDWRKLRNEQLNDLYCSSNVLRLI